MKVLAEPTTLDGVLILTTACSADHRGWFVEPWHTADYAAAGLPIAPVQAGHSLSHRNVLRGMHYQDASAPMGKLVRCTRGRVFDVAVDLRASSATFGRWFGIELAPPDDGRLRSLWVPPGFAHAFLCLSDVAEVSYFQTGAYAPDAEGSLRWDDPDVAIAWPLAPDEAPVLSVRDAAAPSLRDYLRAPAFA
jgi:dTDP-4-dehydrorhamnose 3,5-epimerase